MLRWFLLLSTLILTTCISPEVKPSNSIVKNPQPIENQSNPTVSMTETAENKTVNKMTEESTVKPISLTAKAEKNGDKLVIEYEIQNHTEQILYVWDRMIGYNPSGQIIDQESAYIFWEEPKTLRIVRANLPLPFDRDVARKEIPFVRGIPAKATVSGKIVCALPTPEYSPFYPKITEENSKKEKASVIRLLIGWSPFREGMTLREQTISGEKVIAIRGNWAKPYHQLLEKEIPLEVEVLVHTDVFDRAMPMQ